MWVAGSFEGAFKCTPLAVLCQLSANGLTTSNPGASDQFRPNGEDSPTQVCAVCQPGGGGGRLWACAMTRGPVPSMPTVDVSCVTLGQLLSNASLRGPCTRLQYQTGAVNSCSACRSQGLHSF